MKRSTEDIQTLDSIELHFLIAEIRKFIDNLYIDLAKALALRVRNNRLDDRSTFAFFRSKERLDNVKLVLEYLIYYSSEVDFKTATEDDLLKPFQQFKEAIRFLFDGLLEKDVQTAIFRDLIHITPIEKHSMDHFANEVDQMHHELMDLWNSAESPTLESFIYLFDGLMIFMRFWFELRRNDIDIIRKSDLYVFKLSKALYSSAKT